MEAKKGEIFDVVHVHQAALRNICPKESPKYEQVQEPSEQTCFKKFQLFSTKEKYEPIDLIAKGEFLWRARGCEKAETRKQNRLALQ